MRKVDGFIKSPLYVIILCYLYIYHKIFALYPEQILSNQMFVFKSNTRLSLNKYFLTSSRAANSSDRSIVELWLISCFSRT